MKDESGRTAADWFAEGIRCFQKPDGLGAVRAFEQVIAKNPAYRHLDGDNPYFYLGKINEMEDRLEEAVVMYTRALALDPEDEESLIGRGSCFTVLGDSEQAISEFKKVLAIEPRKRRVPIQHIYYGIAENYRKAGIVSKAQQWGRKALEADPHNHRIQQFLNDLK